LWIIWHRRIDARQNDGSHSLAATDPDGVRQRLQSKNVNFRESIVPRTGDAQFFMYDPDGVGVELNFPKT
jgi:hypothetical protein